MQEQGKIISCVQLVVVSKQDNSLIFYKQNIESIELAPYP